jgi:glucose-6-phosphate 1-dehydrogenase
MSTVAETLSNPFASRFMHVRHAGPFNLVIFGASGDLTKRKLIPALFNLYLDGFLAKPHSIVGFARRQLTDDEFRADMMSAVRSFSRRQPRSDEQLQEFASSLSYVNGTFEDEGAFRRLRDRLKACSLSHKSPENSLFYLATPPEAFQEIVRNLSGAELVTSMDEGPNWSRIVIEKPFGHDTASAWELNGAVHQVFTEKQVYRIDHYLGKETVQNLLVLRLGNSIFEPLWNRRYIDNVQISVTESIGIGTRAGYFESAGAIRDMVQSHIFQVFALIAMEAPASFEASALHDEKVKVLKSLRPMAPEEVVRRAVRGQYGPGSVGGEKVKGYLEEPGVAAGSQTDTFVALKLNIENWRWSGVPFYIRTGKRLPKRVTEVSIVFREPPHLIFQTAGSGALHPNILRLRIQPQEGISLTFGAKMPGFAFKVAPVRMDFNYASSFGAPTLEAYERLILDAITGDSTLFSREDFVEKSWQFIDRITSSWTDAPLHVYPSGDWGPAAAKELLNRDGREWLRL